LPQGFNNSPTIFRTALASNLKAFSANQHGYTLLQNVDDLLLSGPTQEDCMERTHLLLLFYGRQDTKSLGKGPRFAKTLSNTSAFTCPRGNTGSALRGSRLYVPSQSLRPAGKLESFWDLQVSVESESLITPSWQTPLWSHKEGRTGAFGMGEGARESF
jgi:hypothetical protein